MCSGPIFNEQALVQACLDFSEPPASRSAVSTCHGPCAGRSPPTPPSHVPRLDRPPSAPHAAVKLPLTRSDLARFRCVTTGSRQENRRSPAATPAGLLLAGPGRCTGPPILAIGSSWLPSLSAKTRRLGEKDCALLPQSMHHSADVSGRPELAWSRCGGRARAAKASRRPSLFCMGLGLARHSPRWCPLRRHARHGGLGGGPWAWTACVTAACSPDQQAERLIAAGLNRL